MEEVMVKTHLIVTGTEDDYHITWLGGIGSARPQFENDMPIFAIVGGNGRIELNTTDMQRIEKVAKLLTAPKGRSAVTTDTARIYIKEIDDNEKLIGYVTHNHIKSYAPMYDAVGYR